MASMHNFLYFLKEALIGFKRNWSTALGAIITIFLSLFVIGLFMMATVMINNILGSYENEVNIGVYIADDASQDDINTLEATLNSMDNVKSVTWVSKEQALEEFANSNTTNPQIIEQLDGTNPLPASFRVELNDPEQVETVANEILADPTFVKICDNPNNPTDSLKYGQQTVRRLFQIVNYIRIASVVIVALLIFVTFIFINNTIRLAILARRKEIAIERLVGASNGFIRGPFLMEGALQAIIGAALAIVFLTIIKNVGLPKLQASISFLNFSLAASALTQISLILVVIGLIIGIFGSLLAMRRYLKV